MQTYYDLIQEIKERCEDSLAMAKAYKLLATTNNEPETVAFIEGAEMATTKIFEFIEAYESNIIR